MTPPALAVQAPSTNLAGGARLRRLFAAAGFDAAAVAHALHGEEPAEGRALGLLDQRDAHVHRRRLGQREDALALLIRLFLLGEAIDLASAERQLGDIESLVDAGLVGATGDQVRGLVRVVPHDDLLLVSDGPESGAGADHVAGVHRPSATLAYLTVRRSGGRALDLGTGLGIQALLLARHSQKVVATDVNERALAFAAFNAAINGVRNVEFRHGSFFDPVQGERFEIAVCNPPYVISPAEELTYRDGPLPRDGVSELVVRSLPSVLEPEGVATAMISWVASTASLTARPRQWAAEGGCDAILLCSVAEDALTSAASWNRDTRGEPGLNTRRIDEWADYFAAEGIETIAYGALVVRRGRGSPWWAELRLPTGELGPASNQIERMLTSNDLLADATLDDLLETRLAVVPGARIDLGYRRREDSWEATERTFRLDAGIPVGASLDDVALDVIRRLDGEATLRQVLTRCSGDAQVAADVLERAGHLAERLLRLGLVTAAGAA